MRIGLISQEYPPETAHGGIGTQTYLKAHGLASLGHEMHVISHSTDQNRHEYWDGAVHVIRIPSIDNRMPIYTEPARWLTYSVEVAMAVAQLHAHAPLDLVDFPEWGSEGYVHLLNRTEWNHIPTVIHLHGPLVMFSYAIGWPEPESMLSRVGIGMEETCLHLADAVFSSSRCSVDWCVRYYRLNGERIPILHTGVDTRLFRPLEIPKSEHTTIVFVGKIAANKGVDLLLEAALRLAADFPDLRLRMLGRGDGMLMEKLHQRAGNAGFPELLELPGFVARQDLPAELAQAHVFAAPSLYEGGPGFVYLEAMACGLPVIACADSGAAEVVMPEINGLLIPPGDVTALAGALRRLLGNSAERNAMGERARHYAATEADSRVCLQRLEAFYRNVVATVRPCNR